MKTNKIIDLLVKIANDEEAPNKIKYDDKIYDWCEPCKIYERLDLKENRDISLYEDIDNLNDEVEIIEIEKPKKIENMRLFDLTIKDEEKKLGYTGVADTIDTIYCKLDEIIDELNHLLEKSDKDD